MPYVLCSLARQTLAKTRVWSNPHSGLVPTGPGIYNCPQSRCNVNKYEAVAVRGKHGWVLLPVTKLCADKRRRRKVHGDSCRSVKEDLARVSIAPLENLVETSSPNAYLCSDCERQNASATAGTCAQTHAARVHSLC